MVLFPLPLHEPNHHELQQPQIDLTLLNSSERDHVINVELEPKINRSFKPSFKDALT